MMIPYCDGWSIEYTFIASISESYSIQFPPTRHSCLSPGIIVNRADSRRLPHGLFPDYQQPFDSDKIGAESYPRANSAGFFAQIPYPSRGDERTKTISSAAAGLVSNGGQPVSSLRPAREEPAFPAQFTHFVSGMTIASF
jgi:hypothetical protein